MNSIIDRRKCDDMSIPILKTLMNILCISTTETSNLQIDIQPRIIVDLSNTFAPIDPITGDEFYFINNDSTGTLTLECGIKYMDNSIGNYELPEILYYLTKFIKKGSKNEVYSESIHRPFRIPFPKQKPEISIAPCEDTDEKSNEISSSSPQSESLSPSVKISIGISGNVSDIIRRLKNYFRIAEGDSFNDVSFSYTFIEQKHKDNPIENTTPATITSKMFAFSVEEIKNGAYYMSLNYVKPENYHIPINSEFSISENPQLTK